MKEKDGIIDCPQQQLILYVEKEDGTYEPLQTGSYLTKNSLMILSYNAGTLRNL